MNLMRWVLFSSILLSLTTPAFGAVWPPISDSDRSLTSIPEQPGAPAVILMREQTDDASTFLQELRWKNWLPMIHSQLAMRVIASSTRRGRRQTLCAPGFHHGHGAGVAG
jgi:hypothetical protein